MLLQGILPGPGERRIRWNPRHVEWRGAGFWLATLFQPEKEISMKFRTILVASVFALTSSVAYAFSCPTHMKAIDAALAKNLTLTSAQMADVKKYRADGEKLHKDGKHTESLEALAKAEKILGIKM
jgi:hypothetical protein